MLIPSRRRFLRAAGLALAAPLFPAPFATAAEALKRKVKITDVKCMWPDLVVHEGPIWAKGYLPIQDKPGYGIEINPDVARAHLAPGETWWG
jgi:L-alanine-DL-glutamate epimerase-like enolase superfamily enzyme